MSSSEPAEVKIVVVGDGAVGKTCLLYVYVINSFPEDYVPTIYDDYTSSQTFNNRDVSLSLWDTAGQEEYDSIRPLSYEGTQIFLVCFSCVSKGSLQSCKEKWAPELVKNNEGKVPVMVLVGLKSDLKDSTPVESYCTDAEIEHIRQAIQAKATVICSAKTRKNVPEVFSTALRVYFEGGGGNDRKENRSEIENTGGGGCCTIL